MERKQEKIKMSSENEEIKSVRNNRMPETSDNPSESPDAVKSAPNNQSSTERGDYHNKNDENGNGLIVGDWSEIVSKSSGKIYYYNSKTDKSQWEKPEEVIDWERLQNVNQPTSSEQAHDNKDCESSKTNEKAEILMQTEQLKDEFTKQDQKKDSKNKSKSGSSEEDVEESKENELRKLKVVSYKEDDDMDVEMKEDDKKDERVIEKIVKKRLTNSGKLEYFLKWEGFPHSKNTWEPLENLNCPQLIKAFEDSLKMPKKNSKSLDQKGTAKTTVQKKKADDHKGGNINSLPDEVFIKIFRHLRQDELTRNARVCKQWHKLTRCPQLWEKVDVKLHWNSASQNKAAMLLCETLPSCVKLIRLDFQDHCHWKDFLKFKEFCVKLATQCPSLEALVLRHAIFSVSLQSVIDMCCHYMRNLTVLSICFSAFGNHSVKGKYDNHSKIIVLEISLADLSKKLSLSKMPSLSRLSLLDVDSPTGIQDNWFQGDVTFLHNLRVLNMPFAPNITSRTIRALQTHASKLTYLYLCWTKLKDSDFTLCSSAFPQLRTLCIKKCCKVTCEAVVSFVRSCQSLHNVYVEKEVAKSYALHPFIVANPSKLHIVKTTDVQCCMHILEMFSM